MSLCEFVICVYILRMDYRAFRR